MDKLTLWGYGEGGAEVSALVAFMGLFVNWFLGGWDNMLVYLIILMVVDYLTGLLASVKRKKTNSSKMFWGGINKILVLMFVGVCVVLDGIMGNTTPILRTAAIWFYMSRELLSIVENSGKLGVPLPKKLLDVLEQLTERGESK